MHVFLHAGARGFANVGAHVESLRFVQVSQDRHTTRGEFHHFTAGLRFKFFEDRFVLERHDHQVPARVRVAVEDHVGALASMRDEVLRAVFFGLRVTKNTPVHVLVIFDVCHTPRRPELIHGRILAENLLLHLSSFKFLQSKDER